MNRNKIKVILSGLLIQACFFSTSVIADTKWAGNVGYCAESYQSQSIYDTYEDAAVAICLVAGGTTTGNAQCDTSSCGTVYMNIGSSTCIDPAFVQLDGSCGDTDPNPPLDCSSEVDTVLISVSGSTASFGSWVSPSGCGYSQVPGTAIICDENVTFCDVVATGTGEAGVNPDNTSILNEDPNYTNEDVTDSSTDIINLPDNSICDGVGENCLTSSSVTETSSAPNITTVIKSDDLITTTDTTGGTNITTVETSVQDNIVTGEQTVIETTTITNTSDSTNISITNISTGDTTTTSVGSTTSTTTSTTTTQLNSDGTTQSIQTETSSEFEEPHPSDCGYDNYPPCKVTFDTSDFPSSTDYESDLDKSLSDYDGFFAGSSIPQSSTSIATPSRLLVLGSVGSCDPALFQSTVLGSFFDTNLCEYLAYISEALYWVFSVYTFIFVYGSFSNLNRSVHV